MSLTFLVSHFDISGKFVNDEQPEKIPFIFKTFRVFHLDISGKVVNFVQLLNISLISTTF